ncbi:MAG: TRAP transporter small permease [Rhodospirillaceae bacterium]|nr:TRAP transporter small permease [Rhodospirillaceae bacterium]
MTVRSATGAPALVVAANRVLAIVAGSVLFVMMALTFADVWGRYLFNRPVFGGYEVTEFLMGVLIFSGLPILCAKEGHVTIDILDGLIPKGAVRWQRFVINAICAVCLAYMAWRLYRLAGDLYRDNEVTMTLKVPHYPFCYGFAALSAIAFLATLVNCWGYLTGAREQHNEQVAS